MSNLFSFLARATSPRLGLGGSLTVLTYHRVKPIADAMFPEWPTVSEFRKQIQWLKSTFEVVALDSGLKRVVEEKEPCHLAAITFDDGYLDNIEHAFPVLHSEGVSASFFVSTAYLDGQSMFNDIVCDAVAKTAAGELGVPHEAGLVIPLGTLDQKRAACRRLIDDLKFRHPDERDPLSLEIARRLGVSPIQNQMMSGADLCVLMANGMLVGAHSHRHVVATTVSVGEFKADAQQSRDTLLRVTGHAPRYFAFPNGRYTHDFKDENMRTVEELGFEKAFSSDLGSVRSGSPGFRLPRFTPWSKYKLGFQSQLLLSSQNYYRGQA